MFLGPCRRVARPRALRHPRGRSRGGARSRRRSSRRRSRRRGPHPYNVYHPGPIPVPPPPTSVPDTIERCRSRRRAISGVPDLMHHKYAIRDGESVLTGSTNWTEDSWSRQENVACRRRLAGDREPPTSGTSRSSGRVGVVARTGDVDATPDRGRGRRRYGHGSRRVVARRSPTGSRTSSTGHASGCGSARR